MGCEGWAQKEKEAAVSTRRADRAPAPGAAEPEIPLELSLPGPSFTSETEFAREREAILFADWFCVGREESLGEDGVVEALRREARAEARFRLAS